MIGLIVWALLIIVIVLCINPEILLVSIGLYASFICIYYLIEKWRMSKYINDLGNTETGKDELNLDAEKDAWEKKWGRKHPTRTEGK